MYSMLMTRNQICVCSATIFKNTLCCSGCSISRQCGNISSPPIVLVRWCGVWRICRQNARVRAAHALGSGMPHMMHGLGGLSIALVHTRNEAPQKGVRILAYRPGGGGRHSNSNYKCVPYARARLHTHTFEKREPLQCFPDRVEGGTERGIECVCAA